MLKYTITAKGLPSKIMGVVHDKSKNDVKLKFNTDGASTFVAENKIEIEEHCRSIKKELSDNTKSFDSLELGVNIEGKHPYNPLALSNTLNSEFEKEWEEN